MMAWRASKATIAKAASRSQRGRISDSPTAARRTSAGWQMIRNRGTSIVVPNESASARAVGTNSDARITAKRQASTERPAQRHTFQKHTQAPTQETKYVKVRNGNPPPPARE